MEVVALNRTVLLDCAVRVVWSRAVCDLGGGFPAVGAIRVSQRCRLSVRVDVGIVSALSVQVLYARDSVLFLCISHVFRFVWKTGLRNRRIDIDECRSWTDDGVSASLDELPLLCAGRVGVERLVDG